MNLRRGSSRDPSVLFTGRENLRLIVMGVLAIAGVVCLFVVPSMLREGDSVKPPEAFEEQAPEPDGLRTNHVDLINLPQEIEQQFRGIEVQSDRFGDDRSVFLARAADRLARVPGEDLSKLSTIEIEELLEAESRSGFQAKPFQINGILALKTWDRTVGGLTTICGVLYPETALGEVSGKAIGFIAGSLSAPSSDFGNISEWPEGTWVTFHGFYICDHYFWKKIPQEETAPLFLAGRVFQTVPSEAPREEISQAELNATFAEYDEYFPRKQNEYRPLAAGEGKGPPQDGPSDEVFVELAQLALAHRDDEHLFDGAEHVYKEMFERFMDYPEAERGKRFIIPGNVYKTRTATVGHNRFRIQQKQEILLSGRYGLLWVDSPFIQDLKVGDRVEAEVWFACRINWRAQKGSPLDKPYFVARAIKPLEIDPDSASSRAERILVISIAIATFALLGFFAALLFRDRKRSEAARQQILERRRRRREKVRSGAPS